MENQTSRGELRSRTLMVVGLMVALLVTGASIANAIRTDSLDPIWTIAWLPAVLVALYHRPASRRRCFARIRRRPQS
jgi:hypothetical protein